MPAAVAHVIPLTISRTLEIDPPRATDAERAEGVAACSSRVYEVRAPRASLARGSHTTPRCRPVPWSE